MVPSRAPGLPVKAQRQAGLPKGGGAQLVNAVRHQLQAVRWVEGGVGWLGLTGLGSGRSTRPQGQQARGMQQSLRPLGGGHPGVSALTPSLQASSCPLAPAAPPLSAHPVAVCLSAVLAKSVQPAIVQGQPACHARPGGAALPLHRAQRVRLPGPQRGVRHKELQVKGGALQTGRAAGSRATLDSHRMAERRQRAQQSAGRAAEGWQRACASNDK